jgi:hypothetical protein
MCSNRETQGEPVTTTDVEKNQRFERCDDGHNSCERAVV